MKTFALQLRAISVAVFCIFFILSCRKQDKGSSSNPGNSAVSADALSDHLQFFKSIKKQGKVPAAPHGSSLKISFKDTLYLMDQVEGPIKFQHLDTTQNVAGVFLQVQTVTNSGTSVASYYYDVPDVAQVDSSDTVSVVMIGFDPTNIQLPASFNLIIIPYNGNHQPIGQATRPVKIAEHKTNPKNSSCGLVLPDGEYWDWEATYGYKLINGTTDFFDDPNTVFGASGQNVGGSCCNGFSLYGICPGERQPNRSLHFATYYRIMSEMLVFHDDGSFFRQTIEDGANPLPDVSDFCAGKEGVIKYFLNQTTYNGTYTVTPTTLPPDIHYTDSLKLSLLTTSSSPKGGGYGNGGGVIHQLDCSYGELVLMQIDKEGFGQHLFRFYTRRKTGESKWFDFK